jgi:hypothetical protein
VNHSEKEVTLRILPLSVLVAFGNTPDRNDDLMGYRDTAGMARRQ